MKGEGTWTAASPARCWVSTIYYNAVPVGLCGMCVLVRRVDVDMMPRDVTATAT